MTTATGEQQEPPKRRAIWLFVLLVTIASVIAAGTFAAFSGDEFADAAKTAERGPDYASGVEALYAFAIPGVASFVALVILIIIARGRRAPFWKFIVAFLIILIVTTVIAVPIRLFTFTEHVSADDEAIRAQYEEARDEVNALRSTVFDEDGFLQMPGGGPPILTPNATLDQRILSLQGQRDHFASYRRDVEEIIARRRAELEAMDVFYASKLEGLQRYDRVFRPHVSRHLELMEQELSKEVEAAEFLRDHRASWVLQDDNIVAFTDRNVMRQYAEMMRELDAIGSELDRVDGALDPPTSEARPEEPM